MGTSGPSLGLGPGHGGQGGRSYVLRVAKPRVPFCSVARGSCAGADRLPASAQQLGAHPPVNGAPEGGRAGAISTLPNSPTEAVISIKEPLLETLSSLSSRRPAGGLSSPGPRPCSVVTQWPSHWGPPPVLKHSSCC